MSDTGIPDEVVAHYEREADEGSQWLRLLKHVFGEYCARVSDVP